MKFLILKNVVAMVMCLFWALTFFQGRTVYLTPKRPISKTYLDNVSSSEKWIHVPEDITLGDYFNFMDSLVTENVRNMNYPFSEHILVRTNPWIIDTLANTDYYRQIAKDSFVYDQRKMIVLHAGDSLRIPDSTTVYRLLKSFENTLIDVNIPEYKLRIYQNSILKYAFPIRVGQNTKKYLAMGDRITNLQTIQGNGTIVRHERNPEFYNPVKGNRFYLTKRDDGKTTMMPQIPWIETEINGLRYGQMIHPTTNPETLEKAYSNGCIGTNEADMWYIYYYAPIGTRIHIRYALEVSDENGNTILLKDIYNKATRIKQ